MQPGRSFLRGILAFAVVLCGVSSIADAAPPRAERLAGRLVVRERAGLSARALDRTLRAAGVRRLARVAELDANVIEADDAELAAIEATLRRSGVFRSVERDYVAHATELNDLYFQSQWGLARVGAPASWTLSSGAGVTVAVLDSGVELTHPDLLGHLQPGYDFINDDSDPDDDNGHGTRMTGIIAATQNNAIGISGVAPQAQILPVKVLDAEGNGPYSVVASGIAYAVDHGARVLNLSLAGTAPSSVLQAAIDYATAHDVVLVAASGNAGNDVPTYPAAASGAVAVGAINSSDQRAYFSNYGAWLSFAAPGDGIVTTTRGGLYGGSSGTSPAAAFGSGVFALLFGAHPTMSRSEAIARVEAGTVDLGSNGWDPYFGEGRADAYAALVPGQHGAPIPDAADPEIKIVSPAKDSLVSGMVPIDIAATDDVAIARVDLFVDDRYVATASTPPYGFVLDAGDYGQGVHKLRAYAYDTAGNSTKSRNHKLSFTSGVGLLVSSAKARSASLSITAKFALPAGTSFDPAQDAVTVSVTSAQGTVLSATVEAGSLIASGSGKMQGTVRANVPTVGSVRITAKPSGDQAIYSFKLKASNLSGMTALSPQMNLAVQVGDAQLSQSLPFRAKGTTLIYP
jgi:thermitase